MNPLATSKSPLAISFGMIVLNGEPFTRYNLRALYPYAHEIIVIEGACPSAAAVATTDGHSTDGTLELLREFKRTADPEGKIIIVTAEDDGSETGFWPGKNEMSMAYARRATGNYLWQIDSDEFYHDGQIKRLLDLLDRERPDMVTFPTITFWGGLDYIVDGFYLIRDRAREFNRLFAWGPGYRYKTHFPPMVTDDAGVELTSKRWLKAGALEKQGIFMYHYALLFPLQVFNKVAYYKTRNQSAIDSWEESVYRRLEKPFRAHNVYYHLGWLERFKGEHPAVIKEMMNDIKSGAVKVEVRDCRDVERLLSRSLYVAAARFLRVCAQIMAHQPFNFICRTYFSLCYRVKKSFAAAPKQVDLNK